MKILFVTDAWTPQINGVVRTLKSTIKELNQRGHQVKVISPMNALTIPCPSYRDIPLTVLPHRHIRKTLGDFRPEAIHIVTEGPLGWAMRQFCLKRNIPFTTAFHTKFPDYIHSRYRIPTHWTYNILRAFHTESKSVMVNTKSMKRLLWQNGFRKLRNWSRGVDTDFFRPIAMKKENKMPCLLYVGRIAVEKNLEDFFNLKGRYHKVVVGDGPWLAHYRKKYPTVEFRGRQSGLDLVRSYSEADVFVFPSRTDTFGLVMLEALACGTPVAAYPTEGPIDVIQSSEVGCLNNDLAIAVKQALKKSATRCVEYATQFSWSACTDQFLNNLSPIMEG